MQLVSKKPGTSILLGNHSVRRYFPHRPENLFSKMFVRSIWGKKLIKK